MNLPNSLTLARIFLVPLLVVVLLTKFEGRLIFGVRKELIGAAIFGLAALTDWLDGYLARRRHQITTLGKLMDPIADKLLVTAALVSLVQMDLAPAWMVAVILGREFAVTGLRSVAYARSVTIPASPLGKFKMASQVVAILLLILGRDHLLGFFVLGQVALWIVVGSALASAIDYYRRYNYVLNPRVADFEIARPPRRSQEGQQRLALGRSAIVDENGITRLQHLCGRPRWTDEYDNGLTEPGHRTATPEALPEQCNALLELYSIVTAEADHDKVSRSNAGSTVLSGQHHARTFIIGLARGSSRGCHRRDEGFEGSRPGTVRRKYARGPPRPDVAPSPRSGPTSTYDAARAQDPFDSRTPIGRSSRRTKNS